jgi:hypothetical protein
LAGKAKRREHIQCSRRSFKFSSASFRRRNSDLCESGGSRYDFLQPG